MPADATDHTLEFLLAFDGDVLQLKEGYWIKFRVYRIEPTSERPHGLYYSLTLHEPGGNRIVGFDNAHRPPRARSGFRPPPVAADHWHRSSQDKGRPYMFKDADTLIADFFAAAERAMAELGIEMTVLSMERRESGR